MSQNKKPKTIRKTRALASHGKMDANFQLKNVNPKTKTQEAVFDSWKTDKHLLLHGSAGTGKSFVSLYLALKAVVVEQEFDKIIIIRSTSQIREIGFLPGSTTDKIAEFELPYHSICSELFSRGDAYESLKKKDFIQFVSTSFLRGMTFNNAVIIVDEIQNMTEAEIIAFMTRVGERSRVILCGDEDQVDLSGKKNDTSWIEKFLDVVYKMDCFDVHEFTFDDIVRSKFVKEFLIARSEVLNG